MSVSGQPVVCLWTTCCLSLGYNLLSDWGQSIVRAWAPDGSQSAQYFRTSFCFRRHHSDCHGSGDKPGHHKRRHRGRSSAQTKTGTAGMTATVTTSTATALALAEDRGGGGGVCGESQDRRNYYLDLAGVDSSKLNNATAASKLHTPSALPFLDTGGSHHRSRSHDVKCDNVKRETDRLLESSRGAGGMAGGGHHHHHHHLLQHNHLRSRSFDPQDNAPRGAKAAAAAAAPEGGATSNVPADSAAGGGGGVVGEGSPHKHSRFRPVSLPGHVPTSVSPHYHRRHRHREKDHDLAMQQVAAWIERQHAWDFDSERVIVQRHHHHHIHEHHHHHHYHHYYEA